MTGILVGAAVLLLAVGLAAGKCVHPLRASMGSILAGLGAMGAVNMLAPLTGVGIALNWFTSFMAVVLGLPGVVTVLLLNVLLGAAV